MKNLIHFVLLTLLFAACNQSQKKWPQIKKSLESPKSKSDSLLETEVIHIPGGNVKAQFRRDYYGEKGVGKVTATVIGAGHATGEVEISMSIQ